MITIITQDLIKSNVKKDFNPKNIIINVKNNYNLIKTMMKIKETTKSIQIWDITCGHKPGKILEVSDHINQTGSNPLIGNQQKLGIDFPDLSNLYNDFGGIVTTCLGDYFYEKEEFNSSTWLCHVSILAKSIGIKNIKAKLISI